jgi:hypothetical protein
MSRPHTLNYPDCRNNDFPCRSSKAILYANMIPPVVAGVNREARSVALERWEGAASLPRDLMRAAPKLLNRLSFTKKGHSSSTSTGLFSSVTLPRRLAMMRCNIHSGQAIRVMRCGMRFGRRRKMHHQTLSFPSATVCSTILTLETQMTIPTLIIIHGSRDEVCNAGLFGFEGNT